MIGLIASVSKAVMPRLTPLIALDRRFAARARKTGAQPPVFIIGAPRSGTTILYQRLLNSCQFCWLCNVDSALFAAPFLVQRFTWRFKREGVDHGETSEFGYVPGLWAASEAGPMFRLFLEDPRRRKHFADAVRAVSALSGRTWLVKNTYNSLRLPAIFETFPDAFIVRVWREREATARSILKMRAACGGKTVWTSVKPEGAEAVLHLPPIEQARWQVDEINRIIDRDLAAFGRTAFDVTYEDFIADPDATITALIAACEAHGGGPMISRRAV